MVKKVIKGCFNFVIALVILVFLYSTVTSMIYRTNMEHVPMPLGFNIFTVLTGSMNPHLMQGDRIVVMKYDFDALEIGDIITYEDNHMIVTHRILEIDDKSSGRLIKTKGDYNNAPDRYLVSEDGFIGKVSFRIVPLNWLTRSLYNGEWVFLVGIAFVVGIFTMTFGYIKKNEKDV